MTPATDRPTGSAPLAGHLVVDLSRLLPGPLAARLLADLGARVIKVEEPRLGDPVRRAPPLVAGRGALAAILLSGVESVALDLKRPAARAVLEELLGRADVLLATFRPGGLARLGLDPEALAERHPRLVVCSLTGWGATGPWAARAGHDLTYQAAAGALAATASMPPLPAADLAGAWSAVTAILAALVARATSGRGTRIDASLYDAALHANLVAWSERAGDERGEREVGDPGALTGALPCYRIYETADGKLVAVAALEPHFWRRLCVAAGRRELRRRQYDRSPATHRRVAEMFAERRLAEWTELAAAHDLPLEPVAAPATAAAHPQAADRAVLGTGPEGLPRLAYPARLDGARPAASTRFPRLGEDTKTVLAELGITPPRGSRATTGIGPRRSLRRLLATWIAGRRG